MQRFGNNNLIRYFHLLGKLVSFYQLVGAFLTQIYGHVVLVRGKKDSISIGNYECEKSRSRLHCPVMKTNWTLSAASPLSFHTRTHFHSAQILLAAGTHGTKSLHVVHRAQENPFLLQTAISTDCWEDMFLFLLHRQYSVARNCQTKKKPKQQCKRQWMWCCQCRNRLHNALNSVPAKVAPFRWTFPGAIMRFSQFRSATHLAGNSIVHRTGLQISRSRIQTDITTDCWMLLVQLRIRFASVKAESPTSIWHLISLNTQRTDRAVDSVFMK